MKIKELKKKGIITDKEVEEVEVDITDVIVQRKFSEDVEGSYEAAAVVELIKSKEEFESDWNIKRAMFKKLEPSFTCPYCGDKVVDSLCGSSDMHSTTFNLKCEVCRSEIKLSVCSIQYVPYKK